MHEKTVTENTAFHLWRPCSSQSRLTWRTVSYSCSLLVIPVYRMAWHVEGGLNERGRVPGKRAVVWWGGVSAGDVPALGCIQDVVASALG